MCSARFVSLIVVVMLIIPVYGMAQEPSGADEHCYAGLPVVEDVVTLANTGYGVGYSNIRRNPLWVGYMLFRSGSERVPPPLFTYASDERTSAEVRHEDYQRSGYARVQLAPAEAIACCYGVTAGGETYTMSNVCPMRVATFEGTWNQLQHYITDSVVTRLGETWIMTGPIFPEEPDQIFSGIQIPCAFYTIIIDELEGITPRALGFIIQQDDTRPISECLATVDSIEALTGIDFFSDMDGEGTEEALEAAQPAALW